MSTAGHGSRRAGEVRTVFVRAPGPPHQTLRTSVTNSFQEVAGTTRAGPALSLESRMPTSAVRVRWAISTQTVPSFWLYEDLNHAPSGATSSARRFISDLSG